MRSALPRIGADLVVGAAAPALAVGVHLPGAVHPQMGVEGQAALDAGEEVLAARGDVQDPRPVRSAVAQPRAPAGRERVSGRAGEGVVQPPRGLPDGVSFGHGSRVARRAALRDGVASGQAPSGPEPQAARGRR